MPEVKIVKTEYRAKARKICRLVFVDADFIEAKFGSTSAFLTAYGTDRKVVMGGHTKYAVIHQIVQRMTNEVKRVHTAPVGTPPFRVPDGFWDRDRPTLRRSPRPIETKPYTTLAQDARSFAKPEGRPRRSTVEVIDLTQ